MTKRFQCQHDKDGCTRCCRGDGYVYPSFEDIVRIADHFKLSIEEFMEKYCFLFGFSMWYILAFKGIEGTDEEGCCFLKEDGCSIYDIRPVQCETYPFWEELVANDVFWEAEAKRCPGMDKGEEIPDSVIKEKIKNRKRTHCITIRKDAKNIDDITSWLSVKNDTRFC